MTQLYHTFLKKGTTNPTEKEHGILRMLPGGVKPAARQSRDHISSTFAVVPSSKLYVKSPR